MEDVLKKGGQIETESREPQRRFFKFERYCCCYCSSKLSGSISVMGATMAAFQAKLNISRHIYDAKRPSRQ